jgi:hypothetical protein
MPRKLVIALLVIVALGLPHTLADALGPTAAAVVLGMLAVLALFLVPAEPLRQRIKEAAQRLERLRAEQR